MPKESGSPGLKDRQRAKTPRRYAVYIHNDDFTPMDFVVEILVEIFRKPTDEAFAIMMSVHKSDRGLVGYYTLDMASSKVNKAIRLARNEGYPLRLSYEPE